MDEVLHAFRLKRCRHGGNRGGPQALGRAGKDGRQALTATLTTPTHRQALTAKRRRTLTMLTHRQAVTAKDMDEEEEGA